MEKPRLNREWHLAHKMPAKATDAQRYEWHKEHMQNCACREMPEKLRQKFEVWEGDQTQKGRN